MTLNISENTSIKKLNQSIRFFCVKASVFEKQMLFIFLLADNIYFHRGYCNHNQQNQLTL